MDIWKQIGIEKTGDKEAITHAYRERLMVTNPEDKPEEFMRLRQAYEEALQYAEQTSDAAADGEHTPLENWMEKVEQLYRCFPDRIDPQKWEVLLQDPVCQSVQSKLEARDALLRFMMENIYFPQEVLMGLDRQFHFTENAEELFELYPRPFIQNIILDAIQNREYPPYNTLEGDDTADFDGYLELDAQLGASIANHETEQSKRILKQMGETGVDTPYFKLAAAKVFCQEGDYELAAKTLSEVKPLYHNLTDVRLMKADVTFLQSNWKDAKSEYEAVLKEMPDSEWAKQGLAKCLVEEGQYIRANELLRELMRMDPHNGAAEEWLNKSNEKLVNVLEQQVKQGTAEDAELLDLGWCYFEREDYESALRVLKQIEAVEKHEAAFYNLAGRTYLFLEEYERALDYLKNWESLLRDTRFAETFSEEEKKERLGYALYLQSICYTGMGREEEALSALEEAAEVDSSEANILERKGQVLFGMGDYPGAAEVATNLIEEDPDRHGAYILRAQALQEMQYYGQAFDDCERAIELYPYELGAHMCRIEILIEVEEFQMAKDAIKDLRADGLSGTQMDFLDGRILDGEGIKNAAETTYHKVLKDYKSKKRDAGVADLTDVAEVYYRLALLGYQKDTNDFNPVMEFVEEGLKENGHHIPLLFLKADILEKCGDYRSGIGVYRRILEAAPRLKGIYGYIDNLYREMEDWEHALEYANLQLEEEPSAYYHMRRAQLFICLGRLEEGRLDLEISIGMDREQPYAYNYMGTLLEFEGNQDEALEMYFKAISVSEEQEEPCGEAYRNAANLHCRKGDYIRAAELLEKNYQQQQDTKDLYGQIEIYRLGGMFDRATAVLERFREAADLKKRAFLYQWEKGHILRDSGEEDEAFAIYDIEGVLEPMARKEAAMILYFKGKYRKALKYFRKAIKALYDGYDEMELPVEPHLEASFYLWAGRTCLQLGKKEDAKLFAAEGIKKIPEDYEKRLGYCIPMIDEMLGGLHTVLGEYDRAYVLLQKALKERKCDYCTYSNCIEAYYELGYLSEQKQNEEEAAGFYEEGLKGSPFDYVLNRAMNQLKRRMR